MNLVLSNLSKLKRKATVIQLKSSICSYQQEYVIKPIFHHVATQLATLATKCSALIQLAMYVYNKHCMGCIYITGFQISNFNVLPLAKYVIRCYCKFIYFYVLSMISLGSYVVIYVRMHQYFNEFLWYEIKRGKSRSMQECCWLHL